MVNIYIYVGPTHDLSPLVLFLLITPNSSFSVFLPFFFFSPFEPLSSFLYSIFCHWSSSIQCLKPCLSSQAPPTFSPKLKLCGFFFFIKYFSEIAKFCKFGTLSLSNISVLYLCATSQTYKVFLVLYVFDLAFIWISEP